MRRFKANAFATPSFPRNSEEQDALNARMRTADRERNKAVMKEYLLLTLALLVGIIILMILL